MSKRSPQGPFFSSRLSRMALDHSIPMIRCMLCFLALEVMPTFCDAEVTRLPPEYHRVLQDVTRFREIRTVRNLPPVVVALCADDKGKIAEPGQKWEVTDFITDDTLPSKRLIWAAMDGERYVVHYERGGRAHSFHVLVATLTTADTNPRVVWRGVGSHLKDYSAFLAALQSGKLDDTLDYAH